MGGRQFSNSTNSINPMKIPNEMIDRQVHHHYAGNAWIVMEWCAEGWARITSGFFKEENQMFLVWSKLLSPDTIRKNKGTPANPIWVDTGEAAMIHHTYLEKVNEIRDKLARGEWKIKNTRLVKA